MPRSHDKRYRFRGAVWTALIALAAGWASPLTAGEAAGEPAADPPVIAPEAAVEYAGKKCTIEMQVRSARRGENPIVFLNSEKSFRSAKNFTAVIFDEGLEAFEQAGIAEPEKHFDGKKIRVTGVVEIYRDRPQIRVDDPKQIEVVKEDESESSKQFSE